MSTTTEFYGNGTNLPTLHPDKSINDELLIQALCAQLDTARRVLGQVSAMQVVTPRLCSLKRNAVWALDETAPARMQPRSAQWNTPEPPRCNEVATNSGGIPVSENQAPKGATTSASADSVLPAEVREALSSISAFFHHDDAGAQLALERIRSALLAAYGERKPVEDHEIAEYCRSLRAEGDARHLKGDVSAECYLIGAAGTVERLARERDEARARADALVEEVRVESQRRVQLATDLAAERTRAAGLTAQVSRMERVVSVAREFVFDWRTGDFQLTGFAALDAQSIESALANLDDALTPKETKE